MHFLNPVSTLPSFLWLLTFSSICCCIVISALGIISAFFFLDLFVMPTQSTTREFSPEIPTTTFCAVSSARRAGSVFLTYFHLYSSFCLGFLFNLCLLLVAAILNAFSSYSHILRLIRPSTASFLLKSINLSHSLCKKNCGKILVLWFFGLVANVNKSQL